MIEPPDYVIERARLTAVQSPCAKSKRGVVLFNRHAATHYERYPRMFDDGAVICGAGFNGQPNSFTCSGSAACRDQCAKLCLHAEQRAIMDAVAGWSRPRRADIVRATELVHVKVVDGQVVPGGGPSCWQCSRLVVEVGIRGVWLYEQTDCPSATCVMCNGEFCNVHSNQPCECAVDERHRDAQPPQGEWRFYSAEEFHRETLRACGFGGVL